MSLQSGGHCADDRHCAAGHGRLSVGAGAGHGTLIGASANVVLSGISKNNGHPITFGQYFKIGFPMMILSIIVCSVFLLIRFA